MKGNHGSLLDDVQTFIDVAITNGSDDYYESTEKSHGRIEIRKCWSFADISWLTKRHDWAGLRSISAVESKRVVGKKESTERRYFISSHSGRCSRQIAGLVRNHWRVENELTFEGTASPNTNPLLIGVERVDGGVAFTGLIDDLKIWSYAVDDFDLARMYTDVMTDEFVCVGLPEFDFNEDCVTNLEDFAIFAAAWLDCTRVAGSTSGAIDCYGKN